MSGTILVFGGTTEGREILAAGLPCLYSAATEYGAELAQAEKKYSAGAEEQEIVSGRLSREEIERLAARPDILGIIDATHPYAAEAGENIAQAAECAGKPLFRVSRTEGASGSDAETFPSCAEAAAYLSRNGGNALVAVGSKEIHCFAEVPGYAARFHFRVLPTVEAVTVCERLGIPTANLIAEQGPFSELANRAHLERAHARYLVTKDGGPQGGMSEKMKAAKHCGVKILLITRPENRAAKTNTPQGSAAEAIKWAYDLIKTKGSRGRWPLAGLGAEPQGPAPAPKTPMFPLFVNLSGKTALIVGGGRVAARKAETLLRCGASLRVVAPEISPALERLRARGTVDIIKRPYETGDCEGASLAVAATNDRAVNERVRRDAGDTPVNVADNPGACSFFFPSLVEHNGFAAGISSSGQSPAACRALAERLRLHWKDWVEDVGKNK